MIQHALVGLTQALGGTVDRYTDPRLGFGKHDVAQSWTDEGNRENVQVERKKRNYSWLRLVDIDVASDGNARRNRRLTVKGRLKDGDGFEEVRLVPANAQVQWEVPLYRGMQDYWRYLKAIVELQQGRLSFMLGIDVGNDTIPVTVKPTLIGSVPVPRILGEIQEDQIPKVEVNITLSNLYIMMDNPNKTIVPTLNSIIMDPSGGVGANEIVAAPDAVL